jgi:hypothetical protein
MSAGVYFYAICRGLNPSVLTGRQGIADAPVRLVEEDGLQAVVSEVDLEEFGEEGLRRNLEDLAWLETVALAHDRVTRLVAEVAPTAPLRLATVFRSEESLRQQLSAWRGSAERALDRIEGRSEWSVKAYADPQTRVAEGDEQAEEPAGMGAGKAYLLKRRAATQRRERAAQEDAAAAEEIHSALQDGAVAGRRLAPQDRRLTGHAGEMVLNGAYLVDQARAADFKDLVDRAAGEHSGLRLELGGPWPPYSFASLDEQ